LLALAAACIPSHRLVHDGNRYFEHCYGADFDPGLTVLQKEACWQAWIAHYTRHQPAARVDYAMRRVEALESGEAPLSLPGLSASTRPAPLADEAQLASLARGTRPPSAGVSDADGGATAIPNGCLQTCDDFETQCVSRCPEDSMHCRQGCAREHAICLGGCH
jgi:hypothetical protein